MEWTRARIPEYLVVIVLFTFIVSVATLGELSPIGLLEHDVLRPKILCCDLGDLGDDIFSYF